VHQIRFRPGSAPNPAGGAPLAGLRGPTSKRREGKGTGKEGRGKRGRGRGGRGNGGMEGKG